LERTRRKRSGIINAHRGAPLNMTLGPHSKRRLFALWHLRRYVVSFNNFVGLCNALG
jgi:hypothetical protein